MPGGNIEAAFTADLGSTEFKKYMTYMTLEFPIMIYAAEYLHEYA